MIGSFLTRVLVMVLGYAYPAYECYKTVEKNKPQIEELRFWCQYWILVALLSVTERIGDVFISWLPMYGEAKLAFYIFLWYPKTKGTTYVYNSFFKPYMQKHETEIDRTLLELRTKAWDTALIYCQRGASSVQTRIFDILHFVASQSTLRPRPAQPEKAPAKVHRTTSRINNPTGHAQPETDEPASPTSSSSTPTSQSVKGVEVLDATPKTAPPVYKTALSALKAPNSPKLKPILKPKSVAAHIPPLDEVNAKADVSASDDTVTEPATVTSPKGSSDPPPTDSVIEDTLSVTRLKLRKSRSTVGTET